MDPRLKQVALTYATRPMVWFIGGCASLMSVPLTLAVCAHVWGESEPHHVVRLQMLYAALPAGALALIIAVQTKLQFAHARARLMPDFARPHLVVPFAGLLLSVFGIPLLFHSIAFGSALPVACWTSCLVAALIWALYLNSGLVTLLALGIGFSGAWPSTAGVWGMPVENDSAPHTLLLCLLLAGAWGAIGLWLLRLVFLHEEMGEYETRVQVSAWDRSTRSVRMEGRQIGALQKKRSWWLTSWCIDKWHDRIPVRCAAGTVSGSVLYHYGYRALPGWIHATALAFFILFFFSLCLAKGIFGHQGTGTPIGIAFLVLQFSVVLPAITGHTLLLQRWPRLGQELLLPHSRADMIDGLLGALRRDALLLFMTMQMATVALAAGWWPHLLVPGAVVAYLSLAIGSALLGTAVAFWVASRYRDSLGGALIALLIMPLLGVFALWMSWRETSGDGPFWLVAAVLIASGQLVMRRARRSWNTVELGA